jgi:hypothetical protein
MSGGKGGSTTSESKIPDWLKDPAIRNLARAEDVQRIGYRPYYGPDVAGFNDTQRVAAQSNIGAAQAFGLAPQGMTAYQGMPEAQEFAGGIKGYSSAPLFEQARDELAQRNPEQQAQYDALFGPK